MLNLIWLKSLITVIEQHSFQAAAIELGLAQPTITQHIQKLEEMLKVSLIQRGRSGCQPTEHALRLLPYAESMLRLQDRALLAIQSPTLKVGPVPILVFICCSLICMTFFDINHWTRTSWTC